MNDFIVVFIVKSKSWENMNEYVMVVVVVVVELLSPYGTNIFTIPNDTVAHK